MSVPAGPLGWLSFATWDFVPFVSREGGVPRAESGVAGCCGGGARQPDAGDEGVLRSLALSVLMSTCFPGHPPTQPPARPWSLEETPSLGRDKTMLEIGGGKTQGWGNGGENGPRLSLLGPRPAGGPGRSFVGSQEIRAQGAVLARWGEG